MKKDFLKNKIKEQFILEGQSLYSNNSKFISEELNKSDSKFIEQVKLGTIQKGNFYFMFYDLNGKSTKMEKFNPILLVDWYDTGKTRMVYGLSINFIPVTIRTIFFNNLLNYNLDILEHNQTNVLDKEKPLESINIVNIYKLLSTIGFEWSLRKFDITKINKVYKISTNVLPQFITMSTSRFTGVDDSKLIEIWQKKIKEQEIRHKKLIKDILSDYENIEKELTNTYKDLNKENDTLQESLNIIKNIL